MVQESWIWLVWQVTVTHTHLAVNHILGSNHEAVKYWDMKHVGTMHGEADKATNYHSETTLHLHMLIGLFWSLPLRRDQDERPDSKQSSRNSDPGSLRVTSFACFQGWALGQLQRWSSYWDFARVDRSTIQSSVMVVSLKEHWEWSGHLILIRRSQLEQELHPVRLT